MSQITTDLVVPSFPIVSAPYRVKEIKTGDTVIAFGSIIEVVKKIWRGPLDRYDRSSPIRTWVKTKSGLAYLWEDVELYHDGGVG